jgi:phosphoglycolate phosphatase
MQEIEVIIWDWNGTLLNDTDICIRSINKLLHERGLPLINRDHYLKVFGFPIIDYYKRLGFNFEKEAFDIPANQYIQHYIDLLPKSALHAGAEDVLHYFQSKGYKQTVLSASEQNILESSLDKFGVGTFFAEVSGLNNHYAHSKAELGKLLLLKMGTDPDKVCLIGDTVHDFDVAKEMGCHVILVANGHQHRDTLEATGALIVGELAELPNLFLY